jgi:hypothetical protein
MKKLKIIFLFSILTFSFNSLIAFDDLHAKPGDFKEPDKHRIFLRGVIGVAQVSPAESEELSNAYKGAYSILSTGNLTAGTTNRPFIAGTGGSGLEYRYKDRFRIHRDQQIISQSGAKTADYSSIGPTGVFFSGADIGKWDYKATKTGASYFHPFGNNFSLGVIGRQYEVENTLTVTSGLTGLFSTSSGNERVFGLSNGRTITNYNTKLSGFVPGIGFEIKPTRWFEIIYNYESVNLTGTRMDTGIGILALSLRTSTNSGTGALTSGQFILPAFGLATVQQTVKGNIQTLDFVIKYTSWFSTRYGFVQETYQRSMDSYLPLTNLSQQGILSGLLYAALAGGNDAKFNSFNVRFEFSKGFN